MEAESTESKSDQNTKSSEGNNQKENQCSGQAEGGGGEEHEKNEIAADGIEHDAASEGESKRKSLKMIGEDFEQMKAVYKDRYSSVEKRVLRRYANKYLLEGKNNQYNAFFLFQILFCDMFTVRFLLNTESLYFVVEVRQRKVFMTLHCALNVTVLNALKHESPLIQI